MLAENEGNPGSAGSGTDHSLESRGVLYLLISSHLVMPISCQEHEYILLCTVGRV